jgi:hypothetical protein
MASKISIQHAPKWVTELEGKLNKAAKRGLFSAAQRVVSVIQNEIIPSEPRVPVDRGIYRAGWRARVIPDGALVYNGTPAAAVIEDGGRAENVKVGRAMINALAEGVVRKGLTGAAKNEEKAQAGRQIAWAIAQSMKKKGIFGGVGLGIMRKARARIPELIDEEVRAEIKRATR